MLLAAVRVRLFEVLAEGPQDLAGLAARLALPIDAAQRLLDAAVSLRLAERRSGSRYGLGVHGASLLGNPAVELLVEHHALLYRDLADPLALLRGEARATELGRFWSYANREAGAPYDERIARYSSLMASSLSLLAEDILEAYPLGRHRRLLDVGGGEGAFLERAAAQAPSLSLALFDFRRWRRGPARGWRRRGSPRAPRCRAATSSAIRCPRAPILISLVRVIHDHDDAQALQILHAVHRALPSGGVLLLAEPMSGTAGAEPMGDAYFGFYLLAMGQGRPRTAAQLEALVRRAGFVRVAQRKTRRPMLTRLLVAEASTRSIVNSA